MDEEVRGKEEREREEGTGEMGRDGGGLKEGRKERKKEWNERVEMEVEGGGCERKQGRKM